MVGLVLSLPVIVSKQCIKTSSVVRKTVEIIEKGHNNFYAHKDIVIALC
jgi:hypothetical protein